MVAFTKRQIELREGYIRALGCSRLNMSPKFLGGHDEMFMLNFSGFEEQSAFWKSGGVIIEEAADGREESGGID
jgi:hypothetical protein